MSAMRPECRSRRRRMRPIDPDDLVFLKKERPSIDGGPEGPVREDDLGLGGRADGLLPLCGAPRRLREDRGDAAGGGAAGGEGCVSSRSRRSRRPFRIPGGDRQVLLAFTMPKSADPTKEYAVPVGYEQGGDFTFYTDEIFFYDDPHELYKHWGPQIWQAVDAHQVILGMNERAGGAVAGAGVEEREQRVRQPAGGVREPGQADGGDVCEEPGDGVPAGPGVLGALGAADGLFWLPGAMVRWRILGACGSVPLYLEFPCNQPRRNSSSTRR